jgi:hypothetical protein
MPAAARAAAGGRARRPARAGRRHDSLHESAARFADDGRTMPLHWYPSVDAMLARDDFGA